VTWQGKILDRGGAEAVQFRFVLKERKTRFYSFALPLASNE